MIEHDIKLAEYIRDSFEKTQYPVGLKAYSAKRQNERTRKVALILNPLMVYCLSFQTTTPAVLKETKRVSALHQVVKESLHFARLNGLATATELIFGLPFETIPSWKTVIDQTMAYKFDSISMNPLWLLKGSDLNRPEIREQYGYNSKFMLAENAITITKDFISIEVDEIAIASKYYSFDDWNTFLKYQILILLFNYFGYGKELILHALTAGIKCTDLFDHLLTHADQFPVVGEMTTSYTQHYTRNLFDTKDALMSFVESHYKTWQNNKEALVAMSKSRAVFSFVIKYIFDDPKAQVLSEIATAIVELSAQNAQADKIKQTTEFILNLANAMIINPKKDFVPEVELQSLYDVEGWIKNDYTEPLWNYEHRQAFTVKLTSRNPVTVRNTINQDKEQKRTDAFNFFRYMNSGLMRRYIRC
ncbi:MAG: hypothetical protein HQM16_16800 [Deltaproteobacteria bacterium]|nr:hypothetical protein [Deltaproteobacteria bacterium]